MRGDHRAPAFPRPAIPAGKVPVLVADDVDAVAEHRDPDLARATISRGAAAPDRPEDPAAATTLLSRLAWFSADLHPLVTRIRMPQLICDQPAAIPRVREMACESMTFQLAGWSSRCSNSRGCWAASGPCSTAISTGCGSGSRAPASTRRRSRRSPRTRCGWKSDLPCSGRCSARLARRRSSSHRVCLPCRAPTRRRSIAMSRRFVDLSIYLENDVITDPPFMRPKIEYQRHGDTMGEAARFFPGLTMENMPGGEGFAAAETVTLSTHNGTHLDAPWHFHPTQDGGKPCAHHRRGAAGLVLPSRREARLHEAARRSRGDGGRGRGRTRSASAMCCSRSTSCW